MAEHSERHELVDIQNDLDEMRALNERRRRLDPRSGEYDAAYQREMELSRKIRRWATGADAADRERLRDGSH